MRVLIVPARHRLALHEVRNFSGMWLHHLPKHLMEMGHEVLFDPGSHENPIGHFSALAHRIIRGELDVDHVIGVSRHFSRIPESCTLMLRDVVRGAVTQIHDCPMVNQPTDTVFSIRSGDSKFMQHCTHIGWAADHTVLYPEQDPKTLRVLIDHRLYRDGDDVTDHITRQAIAFRNGGAWKKHGFDGMVIRRFEDGGVKTIGDDTGALLFNRQHVPFLEIVEEYRKAHIFIVTHRESVGLSVLESAMCGALVLAPHGFIAPDLIDTVRHVELNSCGDIWWGDVLDAINIEASRSAAVACNWRAVTERIVRYLENFKK